MKTSKRKLFEATMELLNKHAYRVRYVPHEVIEDYNATYNVICEGKHIITNAAEKLGIPLNEIWISEMWKPYEKYILFHELREIYHRRQGLGRDEAHEKALEDGDSVWKNEPQLKKLIREIQRMDQQTARRKKQK